MYGLKTPDAEVAQALLIVMRRGSLRAAEEITGHKYETISTWLKRAATHAAAITQVLATDLHLSQVEIYEFWSFVQKKTAQLGSLTRENAGADRSSLVVPRIVDHSRSRHLSMGSLPKISKLSAFHEYMSALTSVPLETGNPHCAACTSRSLKCSIIVLYSERG